MVARRIGGTAVAAVLCLALSGLGASRSTVRLDGLRPIAATTNHAAVVIDTGAEVKKFCLAFPEDEISGEEALRRVDAQVVFASFGSRGKAVCALCGTGCPSSNCFCDPSRFWAYHRAGPAGAPYTFSRSGVSSTVVRNGDVEGWKWGGGEPPPPATVGEVCDVPEPPARTSGSTSASSTSTSTSTTAAPAPAPAPAAAAPAPGPAPGGGTGATTTVASGAASRTGAAPTTVAAAPPSAGPGDPADAVEEPLAAPASGDAAVPEDADVAPPGTSRQVAGPPRARAETREGRGATEALATAAFVILLVGALVWRARLRAAGVRRGTDVR